MVGTEGAVMVDDSHRDVVLNTMVMELYIAADLSVESNLPVNLPLTWQKKIQSASVSR